MLHFKFAKLVIFSVKMILLNTKSPFRKGLLYFLIIRFSLFGTSDGYIGTNLKG